MNAMMAVTHFEMTYMREVFTGAVKTYLLSPLEKVPLDRWVEWTKAHQGWQIVCAGNDQGQRFPVRISLDRECQVHLIEAFYTVGCAVVWEA